MKKLFRKRIGSFACAVLFACVSVVPVIARAENNSDKAMVNSAIELLNHKVVLDESAFEKIGENGTLNTLNSVTSIYDTIESWDSSAFSQLQYKVPTDVESVQFLNCEYELMKLQMKENGFGENFSINMQPMEMGYASDITASFENVYGDLSHKYNPNVSLPEGWSMDQIMKDAQAKRDAYSTDIKNTDAYKTIRQNINSNGAVLQTIKTLETPELKSALTLQEMINSAMGDPESEDWVKSEWSCLNSENMNKIMAAQVANSTLGYGRGQIDQLITGAEDLQELFTASQGEITAWIDANSAFSTTAYNNIGALYGYYKGLRDIAFGILTE